MITSSSQPNKESDDSIDFKKYFFMVLANWHWFGVSLFVALGISWLVNRYTMPVYQVSGSLIINDDNRGKGLIGYENMIPGMENYRTQKTVLNEIEMLKSYTLTEKALDDLDFNITYIGVGRSGIKEAILYHNSPFIVIPDSVGDNLDNYPVFIDVLDKNKFEVTIDGEHKIKQIMNFGESFSSKAFNFKIILRDTINFSAERVYNKYYFKFNNPNSQVNKYRSLLNVNMNDSKKGSVLILSVVGNNPQQITDYLNKLMEKYISKGLADKNQTAINTVNFIDKQLEVLDSSLRLAEQDLKDFRLENRIVDISSENNAVFEHLSELQKAKISTELETRYLNYLEAYVRNRNSLNEIIAPSNIGIEDPTLNDLISQLNQSLSKKGELLFSVLPDNPKINLIDSKIEILREGLLDYINNLFKTHSIKISDIERQISIVEKEFEKLPETERMWVKIQRQFNVNDQIYTYWLQRRAESAIAKAANVADNKVVDYAKVENTILISPKKSSNNMRGMVIGLILPLALLIILDLSNNKITDRLQIEKKTSIPIISAIGHSSNKGEIPAFEAPKSALAESFRSLRTNLQYMLIEKDQKIVAISSTVSGEGKTFCSSNLAAIFAMAGKKTLLIGLDLRKPKVHKIFNLDNSNGISTCLIGKTSLSEIISPTKIDNLYIATSGPVPPNPAELLGSPAMSKLIDEARNNFDIIILDTPPFGMVTDGRIISRLSDLSLFIIRQNYSSLKVLDLLEEVNRQNDIGQMGLILNDISNKGSYGYGYRYYNYGSGYRYGYYNMYGDYHES